MSSDRPTVIVVPQGAEHQAVLKGLKRVAQADLGFSPPTVISIPIGVEPTRSTLTALHHDTPLPAHASLLLLGLGGSLVPSLKVGAIALIHTCLPTWDDDSPGLNSPGLTSDPALAAWIIQRLSSQVTEVNGVTSTQLISSAREKAGLHRRSHASVVDMEGYSVLEFCQASGVQGAVLRVISDSCQHDVPDINAAITSEGTIRSWPMTVAFLSHPISAIRLIRGALTGLRVLEEIVVTLFIPDPDDH
jgi:nucleoside phosphorylase